MAATAQSTENFDIVSLDRRGAQVRVHGQIEFPGAGVAAVVVMVPGTGLFDRDVAFGASGTGEDKIFLALSRAFLDAGLAVARFDLRGVTPGGQADPDLRAGVDSQSGVLDFAAVYRHVAAHPRVHPGRIVVFAHSEGMLVLSHAIEQGLVSPRAVLGMGALLESPVSVVRWQTEARVYESLRQFDRDRDGKVTNEEIRRGFGESRLKVFRDVEQFLSPVGAWQPSELEDVRDRWRSIYTQSREEALARKPDDPYVVGGLTQSSYAWWQQWFADETPVATRLRSFPGEVSLHYGQRDSQTPAHRQLAMLSDLLASPVSVRVYPGFGHSLGEDALLGPVDPIAKANLVQDALRLLAEPAPAIGPARN
jgi:alpha-beta hydrolase superfamily lysophospholipase